MKNVRILGIVVCVMAAVNFASAEIIRGIDIDFVNIGNAGNATDPATGSLYGAVGYNYRIGKYEITNAQWNTFTNAAGAPTGSPSNAYNSSAVHTGAQQPTNNVSWYEAAQFCNYLTSGDKSKGAYQLGADGSIAVDRAAAQVVYGTIYVIPTEDEWYKAAYHKNDGITGNYWLYPTKSNNVPSNALLNPDPCNNANFYQNSYTIGSPDYLTVVGEFENSDSAYGTFDQGGNAWEWNETLIGSSRGIRGGSYDVSVGTLMSPDRGYNVSYLEAGDLGFRVASVPEPAALLLLIFGVFAVKK
ncbi:MAG: formylglycine-generating enzyme family protein [Phycisphaerae bacterium]|jgi:formylglycine-generating enzyme required for sulfatase activity